MRIEAGGAILHGVDAIAGEEAPSLEPRFVQALGCEAFDRMAAEGGDAAGHGA